MRRFGELQEGKKRLLQELCTPREKALILAKAGKPVVNPLGLPDQVLAKLPTVHKWQASALFMPMWLRAAEDLELKGQATEVFGAFQGVFCATASTWTKFCKQVGWGFFMFNSI